MTRIEAARKARELFERGCWIEAEWHYMKNGEEFKARLIGTHTGYKWKIVYSRNARGVFTACDVVCWDSETEHHLSCTEEKGIPHPETGVMIQVYPRPITGR